MPCVVADTSPLFYLALLGRLSVLGKIYGTVAVPARVWSEAMAGARRNAPILRQLETGIREHWLVIHPAPVEQSQLDLSRLDAGEREAILLTRQLAAECLLIDEKRGRAAAKALGIQVKGTLTILAEAKQAGLLPSLTETFHILRTETTFRFSRKLEKEILLSAGELQPPDDPETEIR